jgi:hypothetical protein
MLMGKKLYDGMLQEAGGGINAMPFKTGSLRASLAPQNEIVQQGDPEFNRKESDRLPRAV